MASLERQRDHVTTAEEVRASAARLQALFRPRPKPPALVRAPLPPAAPIIVEAPLVAPVEVIDLPAIPSRPPAETEEETPQERRLRLRSHLPFVPVNSIIQAVADYFHLTVPDMLSDRRSFPRPYARQIVMYLVREMTSWSLPRIGRKLENRDHTTVLHGCNHIKELVAMGDAGTIAVVRAITAFLLTGVRDFPPPPLACPFDQVVTKWWRDHEIETLKRLALEGRSADQIAAAIGRTEGAVATKLRRLRQAMAKTLLLSRQKASQ